MKNLQPYMLENSHKFSVNINDKMDREKGCTKLWYILLFVI